MRSQQYELQFGTPNTAHFNYLLAIIDYIRVLIIFAVRTKNPSTCVRCVMSNVKNKKKVKISPHDLPPSPGIRFTEHPNSLVRVANNLNCEVQLILEAMVKTGVPGSVYFTFESPPPNDDEESFGIVEPKDLQNSHLNSNKGFPTELIDYREQSELMTSFIHQISNRILDWDFVGIKDSQLQLIKDFVAAVTAGNSKRPKDLNKRQVKQVAIDYFKSGIKSNPQWLRKNSTIKATEFFKSLSKAFPEIIKKNELGKIKLPKKDTFRKDYIPEIEQELGIKAVRP